VEAAADRGAKSAVADLRHEVYALMAHVKEEVEVERDSKALKAEQVAEAFRQRQDDRAMQYLIEFDCHPDFE
jgi:hypothetical protein